MLYLIILILAVNVLVGIFRGGARSFVRLLTLIAVAGLSLVLARMTADTVAGIAIDALLTPTGSSELVGVEVVIEEMLGGSFEVIETMASMIVSPILFLLFYIILKPISLIFYKILRKIFGVRKSRKFLPRVLGGAVMGFLVGLVGVTVLVTSLLGYFDLLDQTVKEAGNDAGVYGLASAFSAGMEGIPAEETDAATGADEGEQGVSLISQVLLPDVNTMPGVAELYHLVGRPCFSFMTTRTVDDQKINLQTEFFSVAHFIRDARGVVESEMTAYGEKEAVAVDAIAEDVQDSYLLSVAGSGIISMASNMWLNDMDFFGVASPSVGDESAAIILDAFFRVFSTTTPETVGEDLDSFSEVFALMVKHDMFSAMGGESAPDLFATRLANSGFVGEVRTALGENERMTPVLDAMTDTAMRVMFREAGGVPDQYAETHPVFMQDITDSLKGSVQGDTINTATLSVGLQAAIVKESGQEVDSTIVDMIAEGVAEEFTAEELNTMSDEEIKARLVERFSSANNAVSAPEAA